MKRVTFDIIENFKYNYSSKIFKKAARYILLAHYVCSISFICYYWAETSVFLPFLIAFFLLMFTMFFFILGFMSYLKHKQSKQYFSSIGPETIEKRTTFTKIKPNLYLLAIFCWTFAYNIIAPCVIFAGYFANSSRNKSGNSIGFFYGAVSENLSAVSLLQFSVGLCYNLIIDLRNNDPNTFKRLDEKTERMTLHGGWYTLCFSLMAVFLGGIGGIFIGETSSIVVFVIIIVIGFMSLIGYIIKVNRQ